MKIVDMPWFENLQGERQGECVIGHSTRADAIRVGAVLHVHVI